MVLQDSNSIRKKGGLRYRQEMGSKAGRVQTQLGSQDFAGSQAR